MLCSNFAAVIAMTCMAVVNFSHHQKSEFAASQPDLQEEVEPVDLIAGDFQVWDSKLSKRRI